MDETIGVKGGKNDRRRTLIITANQFKKLQQHKKELEKTEFEKEEKQLKINQVKTAAVALPLVLTGETLKALATSKKKEQYAIESKVQEREHSLIKVRITTKKYAKSDIKEQHVIVDSKKQETEESKLENIKNREIINRYETKLKEIKLELNKLIYEYNIIVHEYDDIYESKVAQELLDKLNIIIKKIDKLKNMIDIPNIEDYDQDYIYNLITEYLDEFKKNKVITDIKDSELYILISSKIQELDEKKDKLVANLNDKKEMIELDEKEFEELKERYEKFDNFNNSLLRFQADQDALARNLDEKIAHAVSEQERVETRIRFLQNGSHIMMDLLRPQLLIPGARSATRVAVATASLVHIMRNHIRPRTETRRYRIIDVADYTKDITNSLEDIEKSLDLLKKSKKQLEKMLSEFQENYKQYFGHVKECNKLLENLEFILNSLNEKEEEMERLKIEQEKNLEKNNEKVKLAKRYNIS